MAMFFVLSIRFKNASSLLSVSLGLEAEATIEEAIDTANFLVTSCKLQKPSSWRGFLSGDIKGLYFLLSSRQG